MSDNALIPLNDIERMAGTVVESRMFPGITTKQSAIALMLLCQSEGLHPMQALTRYHVIQGRPAMKADAMLAEFMRRGGTVKWLRWDNEVCEAVFTSAGCPAGVTVKWTMEDARKAGVTGNPTWTKYPRQMLKARVASDGVRMADPAVNQGRYTPEEVQDFEPPKEPVLRIRADAEILQSTSLDIEEKPLAQVLETGKVNVNEALVRMEGFKCNVCGGKIAQFPSESKDFPGRLYWMCETAHAEQLKRRLQGETIAKAKAAIKGHYGAASRQWAEVWPRVSEGAGTEAASEEKDAAPQAVPSPVTTTPAPQFDTEKKLKDLFEKQNKELDGGPIRF